MFTRALSLLGLFCGICAAIALQAPDPAAATAPAQLTANPKLVVFEIFTRPT